MYSDCRCLHVTRLLMASFHFPKMLRTTDKTNKWTHNASITHTKMNARCLWKKRRILHKLRITHPKCCASFIIVFCLCERLLIFWAKNSENAQQSNKLLLFCKQSYAHNNPTATFRTAPNLNKILIFRFSTLVSILFLFHIQINFEFNLHTLFLSPKSSERCIHNFFYLCFCFFVCYFAFQSTGNRSKTKGKN